MNIRSVLDKMIAARASDLHLKAGTPPVVRVDGVLYTLDEPAPTATELREVSNQLLNEEQRVWFASHSEIDFAFGVSGLARFRANVFMQRGTPALALRHVPVECRRSRTWDCRGGARPRVLAARADPGDRTHGLGQVDVARGHDRHDQPHHDAQRHHVEDPIEFLHRDRLSFIHQREVGLDTRASTKACATCCARTRTSS